MYDTTKKYLANTYGVTNEHQIKCSLLSSLNLSEGGVIQRQVDPYGYPAVLGVITIH